MDLLPKDLFSHEECPGHVFNTKRMVKDKNSHDYINHMVDMWMGKLDG